MIKALVRRESILLAVAVFVFALAAGWGFRHYYWDDPYIISVYARNIINGNGFAFNVDERIFGTTTPLYTLLISLVGFLGADLPLASNIIGILCTALLSVTLFYGFYSEGRKLAGLICASLVLLLKQSYIFTGIETYLYAFLIYCTIAFYCRKKFLSAALLAGLAILTRYDGILLVLVIVVAYYLEYKKFPWRYASLFLVITVPWFIFAYIYFGDFLPQTFYAKRGLISSSQYFNEYIVRGIGGRILSNAQHLLPLPALLLPLIGIILGLWRSKFFRLCFMYAALLAVGYTIVASEDPWHTYPVMVTSLLCLGYGIDQVGSFAGKFAGSPVFKRIIHVALSGAVCFPIVIAEFVDLEKAQKSYYREFIYGPRHRAYREAAAWLNKNAPSRSTVLTMEPGTIAYYSDCIFYDYWGLVSRRGWKVSWREADKSLKPDFVIWTDYEPEDRYPVPKGYTLRSIIRAKHFLNLYISERNDEKK
jgi:hypothetical protein